MLGGLAPLFASRYGLIVLSQTLALAIACLGVNLLLGYTGLLSLGHAAYFGLGGYAGAFLFTFGDVQSLELHLLAGTLTAGVTGAVVGLLCTRSGRIHFSILTLAFGQVIHSLFISGAAFRPFGEQGKGFYLIGNGGLYIPRLPIAGQLMEGAAFEVALYYIVLLSFLISLLLMGRIVRSPFGLSLRGIRDNELRAEHVGVAVSRYRWGAFVISASWAGLGGALSAQIDRQVTPQQLDWPQGAYLVAAAILGGTQWLLGPALGAFVVVALREFALRFPDQHLLILGALLVVIARVLPGGIVDAAVSAAVRLSGWWWLCRARR
jgi:branched-chain amino acid transport system permease protein